MIFTDRFDLSRAFFFSFFLLVDCDLENFFRKFIMPNFVKQKRFHAGT